MLKLLAIWLAYRDKPWVKAILGLLSAFFEKADKTPAARPSDPDRPNTSDDITNQPTNV